jgi:hypothetical protein
VGLNILFLGVAIVIIGAGTFFPARSARKRDQARLSWPTAKGTVTSSEAVQPPGFAAAPSKGPELFDASVKFQFRAGGQLHFGSTVSYPRFLYRKEEADRIVARYPAGAAVNVIYNPEDFRECYLEIRTTAKFYRTSIALMVVGAVTGLYGLLQTFG